MIAEERQEKILAYLSEHQYAQVQTLATAFGTSAETIRRDLNALARLGKLKRVQGGASLAVSSAPEQLETEQPPQLSWYSPTRPPFRICGFPFYETEGLFRRYPLNPPEPLPPNVEMLAWHTSGGQIRFTAEVSQLVIRVKLSKPFSAGYNTTPLLSTGFDLYLSDGDGRYTFYEVSRFDAEARVDAYERQLIQLPEKKKLDILIHFPIGTGVERILLGMDGDAVITAPPDFSTDRRILFYGGSITQGYCASRPGMTVSNQLSRRLNREVINFGLNGNAKCERSVALAVRMVPNVEWLIVNTEGNCPSVAWMDAHLPEFLRLYRQANPDTKIAVMSFMQESRERFNKEALEIRLAKKACQRRIVEAMGDDKIFFWDGEEFTSGAEDIFFEDWSAGDECTVDTQHKTDLGFWLMANGICRRLAAHQ